MNEQNLQVFIYKEIEERFSFFYKISEKGTELVLPIFEKRQYEKNWQQEVDYN